MLLQNNWIEFSGCFFISARKFQKKKKRSLWKTHQACEICISADLKDQPTPLNSSLFPLSEEPWTHKMCKGLFTGPLSLRVLKSQTGYTFWYKCNPISWNSEGEATHWQCFFPLIIPFLPPSFSPFLSPSSFSFRSWGSGPVLTYVVVYFRPKMKSIIKKKGKWDLIRCSNCLPSWQTMLAVQDH